MPNLNIYVEQQQVRNGDISKLEKIADIIDNPVMRQYEDSVTIHFRDMPMSRITETLKDPAYRRWFHAVDKAYPFLPYFLSSTRGRTLSMYLMGVMDYAVRNNTIQFDEVELSRFVREKRTRIRNLCLPNDVDPTPTLRRLASVLGFNAEQTPDTASSDGDSADNRVAADREDTRKTPAAAQNNTAEKPDALPDGNSERTNALAEQTPPESTDVAPGDSADGDARKLRLVDLWDSYDSIALVKGSGVHTYLIFNDLLNRIEPPKKVYLILDHRDNSNFFLCPVTVNGETRKIRAMVCSNIDLTYQAVREQNGVKLHFIYRDPDGSYSVLTKLDAVFPTEVLARRNGEDDLDTAVSGGEESPLTPEQERIAALEEENAALQEKSAALEKLRTDYDVLSQRHEELRELVAAESAEKQRGFFSRLFGKFFG